MGIAAIYLRMSMDRAGGGLGVDRQEEDCRPICLRRGYPEDRIRVYTDNDISAHQRRKPRADYLRLLDDIRTEEVTLLTAWHSDRVHRDTRELEDFIDLVNGRRTELAIEMRQAGIIDLGTPAGRAVAKTLAAWDQYESEIKAARLIREGQQRAERGRWRGGGHRPYGWAAVDGPGKKWDDAVLNEEEAERIRDAARRFLLGEPLRSICRDFNTSGVATVYGATWSPRGLRSILASARISGRVELKRLDGKTRDVGTIAADAVLKTGEPAPRIISVEDSDRIRATFSDPGRDRRTYIRAYMLTNGLAVCGPCGARLMATRSVAGTCYLTCRSCWKVAISNEPLEAHVRGAFFDAAEGDQLARALQVERQGESQTAELYRGLEDVKARLERYAAEMDSGALDEVEWQTLRRRQLGRRAELERRLERHARATGLEWLRSQLLADGLRERWKGWSVHECRAALKVLIDRVEVASAARHGRWEPSRIKIHWRG
jgi:site-specific DNA recombinase